MRSEDEGKQSTMARSIIRSRRFGSVLVVSLLARISIQQRRHGYTVRSGNILALLCSLFITPLAADLLITSIHYAFSLHWQTAI